MCGIAGILRRRQRDESDASRIRAMADLLVHRGPDDAGLLRLDSRDGSFQLAREELRPASGDVFLGNRRLAIVDLSAQGRQPLHNEAGDVFVVHNGEIYNHVELREQLESRGHVFRSRTDTEVIVHAYEEWGQSCVERFIGMWAFAVWDQRRRELFCSRDRFGVKPFYYHLDDDVFVFASEIKAILPALAAGPEPDYGAIADYLMDGSSCRSPETFFTAVERLEPAHNLVISAAAAHKSRYWSYPEPGLHADDDEAVETFRELFHDAVRLRLRSDVPVGVALSGGLDSTALLAEATAITGGPLHAFTAIFPGERFDEHDYARIAARHYGAELHTVTYSPDDLLADLEGLVWHHDYPAPLPQVLPRWSLMRLASRHVKVILEGQGADEILAGYVGSYVGPYLADQAARLRSSGERMDALADLSAAALALYRAHGLGGYFRMLRRETRKLRLRSERDEIYRPDFLARRRALAPQTLASPFPDRLTSAMHDDHARAQLPMLLKFGDAISMAHSLESRLPFLDHRLVELAFRLPVRHKFHRGRSKVILRQAMAGALPARIESRRDKIGFEAPITRWLEQRLDADVRPILLSDRAASRGILDPRRLERLLTPEAFRRYGVSFQVFHWLSVELWFRMFVDGEGAPASAMRPAPINREGNSACASLSPP